MLFTLIYKLYCIILSFIFRKSKRNDKTETDNTFISNYTSQTIQNIKEIEPHDDGDIADNNPEAIYMTARSNEVFIRNLKSSEQRKRENNSIIMVDNELYSSLNNEKDDTIMIDNELYASQLKTTDQAIMVENEIYAI